MHLFIVLTISVLLFLYNALLLYDVDKTVLWTQ